MKLPSLQLVVVVALSEFRCAQGFAPRSGVVVSNRDMASFADAIAAATNDGFRPSSPMTTTATAATTTTTSTTRSHLNAASGSGGLFGDDSSGLGRRSLEDDDDNDGRRQKTSPPSSSSSSSKKNRFATGEELKKLRADLDSLRENLQWAQAMNDEDRVADLSKAVKNGEARDPEVVYAKAMEEISKANNKGSSSSSSSSAWLSTSSMSRSTSSSNNDNAKENDDKEARIARLQEEAQAAKEFLPRFQLEGLWVGKYGNHGHELINVTYVGDTLIANKVSGDVNVPRGQVSFTAELAPPNSSALEPLKLFFEPTSKSPPKMQAKKNAASSSSSSSSSSAMKVLRYPGKGQIAKPGFRDHKFVEGQLVMFEHHFSFVWVPTRHHVLFKRPTPEQTISLLRDVISEEDEVENMRDHVARCFDMDMTESLARYHADQTSEPFRRITKQRELERKIQEQSRKLGTDDSILDDPAASSSSPAFNFWSVHKWRQYIDNVIRDEDADSNSKTSNRNNDKEDF